MIFLSAFALSWFGGSRAGDRVCLPALSVNLFIHYFLVIPEMEFCHLFPPLENGIMPVLRGPLLLQVSGEKYLSCFGPAPCEPAGRK